MSSTAGGKRRPLKSLTSGWALYKIRASIASQITGAGNATTAMPPPSKNSLAEDIIQSPVGRDLPSMPKSGQNLTTGRGGAGNAVSAKASKRPVVESQTRATLAAEREVVQQHKREQAGSSPLVTGRGGVGNIRKSKSKLSLPLPQPHRSFTPKTQSSSVSSLVLDISPEVSTSSLSRLSGGVFRKRHHNLSIRESGGTAFPSLSREETERLSSSADSSFTSYVIPESTFGALEAHDGRSSNHLAPISSRCYAGSLNPSLTETDRSYYHRRLPNAVAPFEEPPMFFYLTPMTSSSSHRPRRRSVSTNSLALPKESGARLPTESGAQPPTERTSPSGPRTRPGPVIMLPSEQNATPISPLSPPPRFSSATPDPTPVLSPYSPSSAGSATGPVGYQAPLDWRGLGERGGSTRSSSCGPSISDSVTEMEPGRFDELQEVALWRRGAATTPISHIPDPDQYRPPFIPLKRTIRPLPQPPRTVQATITPTTTATDPPTPPIKTCDVPPQIPFSIFMDPPSRGYSAAEDSPTRPLEMRDIPPQVPFSIFVDPPSRSYSVADDSPTSSLASSFRSGSPASLPGPQHESFTPTFGTTPLPPLPAVSRRTTYTSIAPSEYTHPSPPISPVSQ